MTRVGAEGPVTGIYYRVAYHASRDLRIAGATGRFHRAGDGNTTYLGDCLRTCEKEIRAGLGGQRLVRKNWRMIKVGVKLRRVVDLRDPKVRRKLGVNKRLLMLRRKKDVPQAIGRMLRRQGIQGILFESVRDPGHACLAVFLEMAGGGLSWGPPGPL